VRSEQEGLSVAFQLTRNGMKRLDDRALEKRAANLRAGLRPRHFRSIREQVRE
jgi:hypothetical protein